MTTCEATTLSFDHLLADGVALKDFQTVGVAYATLAKRVLIGDEMGLGKTIQALTTIEANDAYPAVVVCPASLRGNWANEVAKFLPGRTAQIVSGRKAHAVSADIVIVGQDVLKDWATELAGPRAFVLDESHYFKTPGAARTKAARALAETVPADGFVIALTGTPVQNRPIELLSQLQILGALEKVAPAPRKANPSARDWEFSFKFAYCGPTHNGHGYEFKGSSNLGELNDRLRAAVLVRRERQDVLGLNDTLRTVIPLTLNGALATYKKAAAGIADFVAEAKALQARKAALAIGEDPTLAAEFAAIEARLAVLRAEVLVTLTTLRTLAGEAKVDAATEWIADFFDSNPERKLVVFAWHKSVQAKLVAALAEYQPAVILGGQADVEEQKARFQADPNCRVIICSIKAAAEGHTLTAASDVLFVEQPWHPGTEQQCEDRCNRIGQEAAQVVAWKLLAEDTVDQWVHELIESKRTVVRAAVIGGDVDITDDSSLTSALIDRALAG